MSVQKPNLAIYMACHHSPYAASRLAPVGDMFLSLLRPVLPQWAVRVHDIVEQDYPDSLGQTDAVVITGSPASVYDGDPWIVRLREQTRELIDRRVPVVGVCFGHQMIASALDGRVERAQAGWGLELKPVRFERREWMEPAHNPLNLVHVHQDQVTRLPGGAHRLAGDDFCPNAAFEIGDRVLTVQGHPEFDNRTLRVLSAELKGRVSASVWNNAQVSAGARNDGGVFARWIAAFLHRAIRAGD